MKVLAIDTSRLTALFNAVRTEGQLYLPQAAAMLVERYGFSQFPKTYDELSGDRIDFQHGVFDGTAIASLQIYGDGMIVESKSDTDLIDRFFTDFTQFISGELGLSMIKTRTVDRMYDSTLLVEADEAVMKPLESVSEIADMITSFLDATSGLKINYQSFGWSLGTDQTQIPSMKPGQFRIERRVGSEFKFHQFLSHAPLKTQQHIAVLEKLEALV